jgi:hypothetical protein
MDSVFSVYFDLREQPYTEDYAFVFKEALKNAQSYSKGNLRLWQQVMVYFDRHDKIPYLMRNRKHVEEFIKE